MGKLRVGVIGVGALGQHHARIYASLKNDVEMVGVCDTDEARGKEIARKNGTEYFTDYQALLEKVEAVSVVVPTRLHHQVGRACLERGVHMLLEKPITSTLEQADDLLALAKGKKVVLQVGHIERFNPAIRSVLALKPRPLYIDVQRLGPFSPRGADVGVVFDLMIHDIDIVLMLKGEMPVRIEAVGSPVFTETEDIAIARLEFADGSMANLETSRITRGKTRKIIVYCEDSYMVADYIRQNVVVFRLKDKDKAKAGETMGRIRTERASTRKEEPLKLEIQSFIHSVRNGTEPEVSGEKARAALEIATKVAEDIRGRLVRFRSAR
jgi:predicted dehydrogenase